MLKFVGTILTDSEYMRRRNNKAAPDFEDAATTT